LDLDDEYEKKKFEGATTAPRVFDKAHEGGMQTGSVSLRPRSCETVR
jgi:hypothetical protein